MLIELISKLELVEDVLNNQIKSRQDKMKSQTDRNAAQSKHLLNAKAKNSPNELPRRRISRIEQLNVCLNRKLRGVLAQVDWVQVHHYMVKMS